MYVIEVIPLSRGSAIESLTYYSSVTYETGSIVSIPVRKSTISAIVVRSESVSAAKTAVRAATFSLRKLPPQESVQTLPASLMLTVKRLTTFYPANSGSILYALLPPEIRDGSVAIEGLPNTPHPDIRPEVSIIQATREDRYIEYRSKIREVFAHRGSVLFVVPTTADIEPTREALTQGIGERLVTFSSLLSKKRLLDAYYGLNDLTSAKLIITTPTHAYLDRHDITHIIVDQSRSRHYTNRVRPYLDHREGLKVLAEVTNRTLTFGDILPRSEEELARREDRYGTIGEHPKRISLPAKLEITRLSQEPSEDSDFELFAQPVLKAVKQTMAERGRVFMYAARRGLAPVVVCADCSHVFRDPDSGAPYSLFKTGSDEQEERWFLSSVSGKRIKAADTCTECGSWRLRERGIGIQHIQHELISLLPDTPVIVFDHTTANTHKKAQVISGRFYDGKSVILLGTQMALPYLEAPVDLSVVTSLDAARSTPSWRTEEDFLGLLLTLREQTKKTVYVQTRSEPDELLTYAKQGSVEQFYDDELVLRQSLSYPPYTTFVLLTWQDKKSNVEKTETTLKKILAEYKPRFYSAPQSIAIKTTRHCLLRIKDENWPNQKLIETLRSLPPYIKIEINPDRIV